MIDVASWLAGLGLGHHVGAFRDSGIAGDVLRDLTDPDLKQFAAKTPGIIEQHDKMTHEITQSLTATGSTRAR